MSTSSRLFATPPTSGKMVTLWSIEKFPSETELNKWKRESNSKVTMDKRECSFSFWCHHLLCVMSILSISLRIQSLGTQNFLHWVKNFDHMSSEQHYFQFSKEKWKFPRFYWTMIELINDVCATVQHHTSCLRKLLIRKSADRIWMRNMKIFSLLTSMPSWNATKKVKRLLSNLNPVIH